MILKTGFTSDSMASVPLEEDKLDSSTKPGISLSQSLLFSVCKITKTMTNFGKRKKKKLESICKKTVTCHNEIKVHIVPIATIF